MMASTSMAHSWHIHGTFNEGKHINGASMTASTSMAHLWRIHGAFMAHSWHIHDGKHINGAFMAHSWHMHGAFMTASTSMAVHLRWQSPKA